MLLATAAPFPFAGELAAAVSALLWAGTGVAFALIRAPVSAAAMNLCKNVTAIVCFAVLLLVLGGPPWPTRLALEGLLWFALSGFVGITLCDTLILRCLRSIGPRRMSLLLCTAPVLVALVSILPPFSEAPERLVWVGMAICLLGIVLAILDRPPAGSVKGDPRRGIRDGLLAGLFQAAAVLIARHALTISPGVPAHEGALVRMLAGTAGLLVFGLSGPRLRIWIGELKQDRAWRAVALAAFFGSFLGIWTNQMGLEWSEFTGVATVLNSLNPIYLIPLSAIFLGERITRAGLVATLIAVLGVVLMAVA